MSANPGDRPRDDSFEDKGSPAQDAKDGDVKHVVSLRRQTEPIDAPAPPVDLIDTTVPGIAAGVASCLFAFMQYKQVEKKPVGKDIKHPLLDKLADQIKSGSQAFLKEEYKYLTGFVLALGLALFIIFAVQFDPMDGLRTVFAFITGATLSALSGWLGMSVATLGNVRTTVACTGTGRHCRDSYRSWRECHRCGRCGKNKQIEIEEDKPFIGKPWPISRATTTSPQQRTPSRT